MASSTMIIFQRAKLSMWSITDLCWCNWRTFWRKIAGRRKVTKGVLFLHDNAPTHWALATQKKLAYLGFHCLDHPPYSPDLAPSDYYLFLGLKNNWRVIIFRPMQLSLLLQWPGWMDNLMNFFELLAKVIAMDKEVYWASWGVCWINPEFGRFSLFPS